MLEKGLEQFDDENKEKSRSNSKSHTIKYRAIRAGSAVPCKI
jgi:hypothetical protein